MNRVKISIENFQIRTGQRVFMNIQDINQLREFLGVYNILTEKCFNSCIREYNTNNLTSAEDSCVSRCIDKQMRVNRRLMICQKVNQPPKKFKFYLFKYFKLKP
nr:Mitochondrial inner membrane translocase complex domain containing protein [Haemonchus contortus]